jgi:simple sugar transport system substrate-binding protein
MTHSALDSLRRPRPRHLLTAVVAVAAIVALAGCTSGKPTSTSNSADNATTAAGSSKTTSGTVSVVVIGGSSSDPFWSAVKRGGQDAAKAYGSNIKVTFLGPQNYDNLGPDAAKLEQTAISQNPSAVVGPDWVPDSQNASYKAITAKGIPLVIYNSGGVTEAKNVGALTYIGADDETAGKAGGAEFAKQGVKNVLCVNTQPGTANQEARCKGIKEGAEANGATSTELSLPSANFGNPSAVTQAVKAALLKNSNIDGVVTVGVVDADSSAAAISAAGKSSSVKLGTFDVSNSQLTRIKGGTQLFAIDQQPYLQGFLAVSTAYQYVAYGLLTPESPDLTGPLLITKDNVDKAISGTKAGVR